MHFPGKDTGEAPQALIKHDALLDLGHRWVMPTKEIERNEFKDIVAAHAPCRDLIGCV
jgi:hypothetical protein